MTLKAKYISTGAVLTLMFVTAFALFTVAKANPSFFIIGQATAAATSTVTFMTAGTATTTLYQPAYNNGNSMGINSATLKVQFTGSSTASSLNIAFEYADDSSGTNCVTTPASCDWYKDSLFGSGAVVSTTTSAVGIGTTNVYSLPFSSSTLSGAGGISSRTNRLINVQTPAQYVRAVITMPVGSLNGAVWAQFIPSKERPE